MPDARLACRPFREQIAFFERKVNTPTARRDDLERSGHVHGFMGRYATMRVRLDMREARTRAPTVANWVRTMEVETLEALRQWILLAGSW